MYRLAKSGVIRLIDGANIPEAPLNRDWKKYQEWLTGGNTPDPMDPEPEPPTKAELITQVLNSKKHFKALVLALNDGSFIPGSNYTNPEIRDILANLF